MRYFALVGTDDSVVAGEVCDLIIVDEDSPGASGLSLPLFVKVTDPDKLGKAQAAAEGVLRELDWRVTGPWEIADTHLRAPVEMRGPGTAGAAPREADEWPAGKSFGELSPGQKVVQARKAGRRLEAELNSPAVQAAISALLDSDLDEQDAAAVERHLGL